MFLGGERVIKASACFKGRLAVWGYIRIVLGGERVIKEILGFVRGGSYQSLAASLQRFPSHTHTHKKHWSFRTGSMSIVLSHIL